MTRLVARTPRRGLLQVSAVSALVVLGGLLAPVVGTAAATTAAPLATVSATTAPASPTATNVGAPSWWVGDCDATRWGPIAARLGWTGVGSHRLGASYLGVPVCGPRPAVDGSPNVQWGRAGWGEAEWQCVEVAQRFMAQVYGTVAYGANGSQVVNNYRASYGGGLVRINNGTVGKAPQPGDIVSFTTPKNPYGHVVVVTSSTVDGNGNGTVTMLSQNDTATGWRTLPVTAWTMSGFGSLTPYAWLHDPAGRGNPLADGTFVRVTGTAAVYRIVGGAPVRVSSWASFGSTNPVAVVDAPQFARLRPVPADGTYLKDSSTGAMYRTAGGSPLQISKADAPTMPGWGASPVWTVDHWALVQGDHLLPVPADRTQVCRVDTHDCFVIAGGAPMAVPATATGQVPGWSSRPRTVVSSAEFASWAHLRPVPADGTLLCDGSTMTCYSTVDGAPLVTPAVDARRLPGWTATAAVTVPHLEFTREVHLRGAPRDGTVLCPLDQKTCFVVAGRAPLAISPAAAAAVPALSTTGAARVSSYEFLHPVHLRLRPVDGTLIQPFDSPGAYVVTAGVATPTALDMTSAAAAAVPVVVDQAAIDNAGLTGPWAHLASRPASVVITSPSVPVSLTGAMTLTWGRPIASSAVTSFSVRSRTATPRHAFTPWTVPAPWSSVTATQVTTGVAPGATVCISVRATNRAGQVGAWTTPRCTTRPLDQTAASRLSRGWRTETSPSLYLGSQLVSAKHGSAWTLSGVTSNQVGVVATVCPGCGVVRISLGGRVLGTLSLASPTVARRQLLLLPRSATSSGALTISVASPDTHAVRLDGVIVSRA